MAKPVKCKGALLILKNLLKRGNKTKPKNFREVVDDAVSQILDDRRGIVMHCSRNHIHSIVAQACRRSQRLARQKYSKDKSL